MGREVKRVSSNFSWPLKKIWEGYINPFYQYRKECPFCDGSGLNPETKKISDAWYDASNGYKNGWHHSITQDEVQALVDAGRLMDFTHTWTKGVGWQKKDPMYVPTAEVVNEWSHKGFGHDSINKWVCVEARAKRLNVYGVCECCGGNGDLWLSEKYKVQYENWERYEPPKGDWYQVWETTSEGSPISPPFETPEQLANWLYNNNASTFGSNTTTYENWLNFINGPAWAPSMIASDGVMVSGVDFKQA